MLSPGLHFASESTFPEARINRRKVRRLSGQANAPQCERICIRNILFGGRATRSLVRRNISSKFRKQRRKEVLIQAPAVNGRLINRLPNLDCT